MSSGDGMNECTVQWLEQGRAEGLVEGRSRHRQTQINAMCRMAARKFDEATAEELHGRMQWIVEQEQIGEIGERLIECAHADAFLNRVEKQTQDNGTNEMITELMELPHESEALCRTEGQAQGRALGRIEVMRRQAARKFDDAAGERLAEQLHAIADSEQVGEVGEWLIACENADELFDRVADLRESSATGGGRQDR